MGIGVSLAISSEEQKICFSIRRKVFIEEQKIDKKIEMDDAIVKSKSFIASINRIYVGTARCRNTEIGVKLERFAVLKPYRGLGVGKSLVQYMIEYLQKESCIYFHAQHNVIDFYTKLGFYSMGKPFNEAKISHQKMVYSQNSKPTI